MSISYSFNYEFPDSRILLFGRDPAPGKVKTRLHGVLGPERALALYVALFKRQADMLTGAGLAPVELWITADPEHQLFREFFDPRDIHCQQGVDLGERMYHAAANALAQAGSVVLLGVDCPSVSRDYVKQALAGLAGGKQVVVGPAEDGGYVLLGLRRAAPELFQAIPWGSGRVLEYTLERISRLGLESLQLATRWDVDRPEDLSRLATLTPALIY